MNHYYAQNPTQFSNVSAALLAHMDADPSLNWFLFVDRAFDYEQEKTLPLTGVNCYHYEQTEELAEVAPWLIPLRTSGDTLQSVSVTLQRWLNHCSGRPMLSLLASNHRAQQIADAWSGLHFLKMDDRQKMVLRFADTRITPKLPQLLSPEQWATLSAPVTQWLTIDREGQLQSCPVAPATARPASVPFEFTRKQWSDFTEAAEPDGLIHYLVSNMSELFPPKSTPAHFYNYVVSALEYAKVYDIVQFPDKVALIQGTCLTNGALTQSLEFVQAVQKREWAPGTLGDVIASMDIMNK